MRYIQTHIEKDLKKKMVFVGGPRQVGKTTLAKSIMGTGYTNPRYLNWDFDDDRQDILDKKWSLENDLLIFDELHKYPRWKSWIKGIYDRSETACSYLITGSARLDVYKKGGDSLVGRYHYWRLHPFTLDEIPMGLTPDEAFNRLMTVGGFPEPFLDGNETEARRWRRERLDRIVREDIRDLESVRNIQTIGLFLDLLRKRVGSLIAHANLAADLEISPKTAKVWLEILERMYLVFGIRPYTKSSSRAILKAPKVYFFDNGDVIGDEGARFENLVASSLLKRLHFLEDSEGYRYELCYVRDKEGREVDFLILKEGNIEELIEVKYSDENISKSLLYYSERLKPKRSTQIVATLNRSYSQGKITVTDPISYFNGQYQW